jgi:hypothetical protein
MKATLEYNLPEEQDLYVGACQGVNIKNVVCDIDNTMRNWLKHGHSFKSADEALEKVRQMLYDDLNRYGINLHE